MRADVATVLFDLDGTLVDSAPDLAGTANDMLRERGRPPVAYAALRAHAGSGARGMLHVAFALDPGAAGYSATRDEFHDLYQARMLREVVLFDGAASVLQALARSGVPWGIVTNKALRFAEPMCRALGLLPAAAALVGGDSTPHTKPHAAPLLEAARRMGFAPVQCIYVGDDRRDMQAARAAGMRCLAAGWGYLGPDAQLTAWEADAVLLRPGDLLTWLAMP